MLRFRFLLSLVVALAASAAVEAAQSKVYRGAIVIDADSGRVLFEDNADYVGPPASMTKLMSFLVVKDAIRRGQITSETSAQVSAADAGIGGTQVWLKQGETFTIDELLMAMMIQSANDAAHTLARATAGSREAFLALMNERSRELGLTQTIWRSPHGLPPTSRQLSESDMTSPREMARLAQVLVSETDITRFTAIKRAPFGQTQRAEAVMMSNHNHLVGKVRGVDGLKTGYTRAAGYCLAATAEREGRRVIGVIMGSPSTKERDVKMAELIELGFAKPGPLPAASSQPQSPISRATPAGASATPEVSPRNDRPVISRAPIAGPVVSPSRAPASPPEDDEEPTVQFKLPK